MPAQRPRAAFEPLPPDFDVRALVEETENFQYVDRISCDTIEENGIDQFEKLVLLHVIIGGKPLVIDGFEERLDPWTMNMRWLRDNHGEKVENARDLTAKDNLPLSIGHYLKNMGLLTEQYFEKPDNYRDKNRQRIYLKDIDCPAVWQDKVREHLPPALFYLNESTGEVNGPGATDEPIPNAAGRRRGKGIAIAGDLMSSLPLDMRAENLMCYIGHEGTYTPAHREMCASLGQNIMVEASSAVGEDGKPERAGSSIWFMTESKDRHLVQEYWLSVLGHDIETENHFAQVVAWKRAPFKTYVVEQRAGDFILIPPLAPHQVWNRGTRTVKVAWNRTTVETLEMAMNEALPNARMVCRDEQYKCKAIVYYTLLKYSTLLRTAKQQSSQDPSAAEALHRSKKVKQVKKDFKRLFQLFKSIMLSETFDPEAGKVHAEYLPYDSNVTCAYCRGNIFNRFLTCKTCTDVFNTGTEEPYDVCMECFAMGRSCACQSKFQWVEQWKWKDLMHRYEEWRTQIILDIDGGHMVTSPLSLAEERDLYPKRTLAQVCQQQLKLRPWVDIKNPKAKDPDEDSEEEIQVNDDGTVKKSIRKRSEKWLKSHMSCHVCFHKHPKWFIAICSMCERGWCFGSLWRAHDLNPRDIMEDPNWECPHCRRVCSTGACKKDPSQKPYEPKGTLLGHDTKKVADVRSVECLVDFGKSNLGWLNGSLDIAEENSRLAKKREEAERAKRDDVTLNDEHYVQDDPMNRSHIEYSPEEDAIAPIDPRLAGAGGETSWRHGPNGFVDPSLLEEGGIHYTFNDDLTAPSNGQYPDPQDHSMIDNGDDSLFIAPTAVMNQAPEYEEEVEEPSLLDSQPVFSTSTSSKKRKADDEQIKLVQKKPKADKEDKNPSSQMKSKATKQYQMEQERKLLDEAKKSGRFIVTLGRLRGRTKLVKLTDIDPEALRRITSRPAKAPRRSSMPATNGASGAGATPSRVLLQSDIAKKDGSRPGAAAAKQKKAQHHVKIPVEDDGDYRFSRRGPGRADKNKRKSGGKPQYEEISEDDFDSDVDMDDANINNSAQKSGARRSTWLDRKNRNEGDEDGPTELPANWKDSAANPRKREAERERRARRATLAASVKPSATKMPRIRPPIHPASTGNLETDADGSDADGSPEPEAQLHHEAPVSGFSAINVRPAAPVASMTAAKSNVDGRAVAMAKAAAKAMEENRKRAIEEENMKAKMAAVAGASPDEEEDDDDSVIESGIQAALATSTTLGSEEDEDNESGHAPKTRPGRPAVIRRGRGGGLKPSRGGLKPTRGGGPPSKVNGSRKTGGDDDESSSTGEDVVPARPLVGRPRGRPRLGRGRGTLRGR
ncbi:hypothetical protein K402DRAFT_462322 [Aulographum hederae CBS 113979]|uniref:JmjC domain-containing protein n=1 Tax=Aulographum hederae CBS 113979 TaxID=1176131 RepID=A0A6G1H4E1_9PEZI|nr:hypothetical protein K402DRAFT_462322 [Aulographum hederae CBS 113979]